MADILLKMVHYKCDNGYVKVAYGGYMTELKKACRRVLNLIESYEENAKNRPKQGE